MCITGRKALTSAMNDYRLLGKGHLAARVNACDAKHCYVSTSVCLSVCHSVCLLMLIISDWVYCQQDTPPHVSLETVPTLCWVRRTYSGAVSKAIKHQHQYFPLQLLPEASLSSVLLHSERGVLKLQTNRTWRLIKPGWQQVNKTTNNRTTTDNYVLLMHVSILLHVWI